MIMIDVLKTIIVDVNIKLYYIKIGNITDGESIGEYGEF